MTKKPHHNVYAVELDKSVQKSKKLIAHNPSINPDLDCFYIGITGLAPNKRLENHLKGYKSSRYVKKYWIRLRPDFFEHLNPMTYKEAEEMEVELAESLRDKGYGVWYN